MKMEQLDLRPWLVVAAGVPLLFSRYSWAQAAFMAYTVTAVLFLILLAGEYPEPGSRCFWLAMPVIGLMHVGLVSGLVLLDISVPEVHALPRILYGVLGGLVYVEWRLASQIIQFFGRND